jgi:hypothetical protein
VSSRSPISLILCPKLPGLPGDKSGPGTRKTVQVVILVAATLAAFSLFFP